MARNPESEIERLKTETDLASLVKAKGIELKKHGASDLVGLCPFHDDKEPSLVISPKKNLWHCLGACQTGGDVIQWVMKSENVSFRHAVELLRDGVPGTDTKRKHTTTRRLDAPVDVSTEDHELLRQVVDYYHRALKANAAALGYLQERGINSGEAIDRFKIGLADRTLGLRLPAKQVKAGAEIRERLKKLGVIRDSGHEHFNGAIVFPIFDRQGRVVEMYGRKITKGLRKGTVLHMYLPGPHAGVWNMEQGNPTEDIILCESIIDALTFWCAGYRNVTCSYGIEGFSDEHIEAFNRCSKKRVLIGYDRDKAGDAAALKLAEQLTAAGFDCYRAEFPQGMDANEYALKLTPAAQSLGLALRKATWMGQGKAPKDSPEITWPLNVNATTTVVQAKAAKKGKVSDTPTEKPVPKSEGTIDATPVPSLAASPQPPAPPEIEAEIGENEIVIPIGNRSYRIRGLAKNLAFDVMKVNVLARHGEAFYVDTFDLYAARARSIFVKETARELTMEETIIKRDIGKVLLKLEGLQDLQISDALAVRDDKVELTDKDKQAALELLKSPNLVDRILKDFDRCGVVGEETNKLVGYLAATSRKLEKPLAVVIQSSSAAGKSLLMDAVLRFVPPEEQVGYSAMTGQSLFYMGGMQLKHKILSIAEEEGVAQASYALKLLQSEGALTIASTGKDPGTGRMETQEYHVEGPVMIFLTTTAIDIDEELLNRCVVLTVDENRQQTRAIHQQQRHNETLAGLLASQQRSAVRELHQDAQRLLRPLLVVNPYADQLAFVDDVARRRRDHMKYLTLIRSIALLHQYQRELQTATIDGETIQYIEVTIQDIVLANRLADQVLGKSIDELPPQTRRLLLELYEFVRSECKRLSIEQNEFRFTRRLIRERLGWGQTQLKLHLDRLLEMEYVLTHRGGGQRLEYELLYDGRGREGQPTMCGLIDVSKLTGTTGVSSGSKGQSSGAEQVRAPQDRPIIGPLTASRNGRKSKQPKR